MDGPRRYYAKSSKSERERQIPYDLSYMYNLKKNNNELTDTENRLVGCGGGQNCEAGQKIQTSSYKINVIGM